MQPVEDDDGRSELSRHAGASAPGTPGDVGDQSGERQASAATRRASVVKQFSRVIDAIRQGDDDAVQQMVLDLSRQHRILAAPVALVVGAVAMLFEGVKLLLTNWRLTLVQVLPAMWICGTMLDLEGSRIARQVLPHVLRGPILVPIVLAVALLTAASFFLNAVFAFAISKPGHPEIRTGFTEARKHHRTVLGSGVVVGLLLSGSQRSSSSDGDWRGSR